MEAGAVGAGSPWLASSAATNGAWMSTDASDSAGCASAMTRWLEAGDAASASGAGSVGASTSKSSRRTVVRICWPNSFDFSIAKFGTFSPAHTDPNGFQPVKTVACVAKGWLRMKK